MPNFPDLEQRIETLEHHFLPPSALADQPAGDHTGAPTYADREWDLIAAYPVFVHAEVEYFCEEIAKEAALRAHTSWRSTQLMTGTLWSIVVDDLMQNKTRSVQDVDDAMVNKAVSNFVARLTASHGIKTKNIQTIFRPLGIKKNDMDQLWLAEMDWLGKQRGGIVHKSVGARVIGDPKLLRSRIKTNVLPPLGILASKVACL